MGQGHYHDSCRLHRLSSLPAREIQLAGFITYFFRFGEGSAYNNNGLHSSRPVTPRGAWGQRSFQRHSAAPRVFTGIKRSIGTHVRLIRLPITQPFLRGIVSDVWADHTLRPTNQLMVAAASFLGFLRCGEALAFKKNEMSVKSETSRSLKLTIQKSKTDSFRQGCVLLVGSTNAAEAAVCPARLTETYMSAAPTRPSASPPFTRQHGAALKRTLVAAGHRAIQSHGASDAKAYMDHSFRSGAAAGVPEWQIKAIERWTSPVYEAYIRTPKSAVTTASQAIAAASRGLDKDRVSRVWMCVPNR